MIRRGQKKRRQTRRSHQQALHDLQTEHGRYLPPAADGCVEAAWNEPGNDWFTIKVNYRIWRYRGRIADFVVTIDVMDADAWQEVERIDCSHGHCHLHQRNGAVSSLVRLDDIGDVEWAYRGIDSVIRDRIRILQREEG